MGDSTSTANGDGFDSRAESDKIILLKILKIAKIFSIILLKVTRFFQ